MNLCAITTERFQTKNGDAWNLVINIHFLFFCFFTSFIACTTDSFAYTLTLCVNFVMSKKAARGFKTSLRPQPLAALPFIALAHNKPPATQNATFRLWTRFETSYDRNYFPNCTYQPEFHFDVFEFFNTADSFGDIISIKWFCNKSRKRYYLLKLIGKRHTKLTVSLAIRH